MKSKFLTLFLVAALAALGSAQEPTKAHAFTLNDTTGAPHEVRLEDERVLVLEWTNKDCPYVVRHYKDEVRTMPQLAEKYAAQGVVWMAIDSTSTADAGKVDAWRKQRNLPYPVLLDKDGAVARAYGAKTTPHMFIVKKGEVLYAGAIDDYKQGGETKINYITSALDEILAGKAVSIKSTTPYGCSVKLAPPSKTAAAKVKAEWIESYDQAVKLAKQHKRPILADFTGSDWCGWCKRLKAEVFKTPEFEKWAEKNVILLELDFPRSIEQSDELKKQNATLRDKFGIRGYPTIVFIDAEGNEVGRTGYVKGGPEAWIAEADKKMKK